MPEPSRPSHPGPTRRRLLQGTAAVALTAAGGLAARGLFRPALAADTFQRLAPAPGTADIGGRTVQTWRFGDAVPGPLIRAAAGGTVWAQLLNGLPDPTTVHWHGVRLANAMDGAPITQTPTPPGGSFDYRFTVPDPGTYFYHSHYGMQLDRGVYGPLIVDDPHEPLAYDAEFVVVLDDWIDGTGTTPDAVLARLHAGTLNPPPMYSNALGGQAGHVVYPHHLVNGRTPAAPVTFTASPGQRARVRLINAASDTAYRVALGGHRLTVTHTDGFPVEHVTADTLIIGMGERYDVLVTLKSGVHPLVAEAEGKSARAFALVRTAPGTAPPATVTVPELSGDLLTLARLSADPSVDLPPRQPDQTVRLYLGSGPLGTTWSLTNTPVSPPAGQLRIPVTQGQRVRLTFTNATQIWHPVHLHGHTYQVGGAGTGPRKDTVITRPNETITVDLDADNPGEWMLHCHNLYHSELGMMATLGYGATPSVRTAPLQHTGH
ncbi:multicopper oxidase family protein [Actinomadura parmotrematis]|uniref:Multicopper oxidase family protein n=1 Tax=Actinomadura parmotrematis TaxID=2864039 RepID=A0ABS7FZL5_9ACTN|nr:multicopper oxidase family protein [Actinomadura parmotrematis]MBW8485883.1 multicopper oxidase family protein [Actinomadura parmotrematis]